jgi:hypothetical protein
MANKNKRQEFLELAIKMIAECAAKCVAVPRRLQQEIDIAAKLVNRPTGRPPKLTDEQKASLYSWRAESWAEISRLTRIPETTIKRYLRSIGAKE